MLTITFLVYPGLFARFTMALYLTKPHFISRVLRGLDYQWLLKSTLTRTTTIYSPQLVLMQKYDTTDSYPQLCSLINVNSPRNCLTLVLHNFVPITSRLRLYPHKYVVPPYLPGLPYTKTNAPLPHFQTYRRYQVAQNAERDSKHPTQFLTHET